MSRRNIYIYIYKIVVFDKKYYLIVVKDSIDNRKTLGINNSVIIINHRILDEYWKTAKEF